MTTSPTITAALGELLPRHLFLEPLLAGARVLELGALEIAGGASAVALHDRGAASVVSLARDPESAEAARRDHGGPGLRFFDGSIGALAAASFDLVIVHDPRWLEEAFDELARVIAPGGRLAVAAQGVDGYRAVAPVLSARFPSVEVATIRQVAGWAVAPAQVAGAALSVEEPGDEPVQAACFLFVCGRSPTAIATQRLVILPPRSEEAPSGLRAENESLRAEAHTLQAGNGQLRAEAHSLQAGNEQLRAEAHTLQEANEQVRAEAHSLKVANDALRRDLDELRTDLVSLRTENGTLRFRCEELDAGNGTLRVRSEELGAENGRLRVRCEELDAENGTLRAELEALRERVLEADLQGDELAALEAEAARARASAKELRDELASLHAGASPDLPLDRIPGWDPAGDALARRARDAEERAEFARLRAREAEESMRAAQRRADTAEGERADALIAARRMQLDAERVRREAAGPTLAASWPRRGE